MHRASEGTWAHVAFLVSRVPLAPQAPRAFQENWDPRDPRGHLALQERWDPRALQVQWESWAFPGKLG